ncbi:MAG: hypothetical protein ACFE8Z_00415 [Candidatus Hermodarchaeota archaeon]
MDGTMKYLDTITPKQLGTLWWSEKWVRILVIMLFPVGIIDATYTIVTTWELGPEVEFNPIARYLIANNLWLPWAMMNILGFAVFSMLAGSYYLHTRENPGGPDTTWISLIISLRVAMATYNVTYYHIPFVIVVYPPMWTGLLAFFLTYVGVGRLLSREGDVSWRGFKRYFKVRADNIRDRRMISTASRYSSQAEDELVEEIPLTTVETTPLVPKAPVGKIGWTKRVFYVAVAIGAIVMIGWSLEYIGILTGLYTFRERYPLVFFNQLVGRGFVVSLAMILFLIGVSMYMILKAFETPGELRV